MKATINKMDVDIQGGIITGKKLKKVLEKDLDIVQVYNERVGWKMVCLQVFGFVFMIFMPSLFNNKK